MERDIPEEFDEPIRSLALRGETSAAIARYLEKALGRPVSSADVIRTIARIQAKPTTKSGPRKPRAPRDDTRLKVLVQMVLDQGDELARLAGIALRLQEEQHLLRDALHALQNAPRAESPVARSGTLH